MISCTIRIEELGMTLEWERSFVYNRIKEVLGMTQVGKMLMDEARQQGDLERARKTALNMLKRGDPLDDIADILDLPVDRIKAWEEETCVMA